MSLLSSVFSEYWVPHDESHQNSYHRLRRCVSASSGRRRTEGSVRAVEARAIGASKCYIEDVRAELVLRADDGTVFVHEFGEPFEKGRL